MENSYIIDGLLSAPSAELMIFGVALFSLLGFCGSLLLILKNSRENKVTLTGQKDLTGGMRGRLEKLDMEINSFRTEILRNSQLIQTELIHARKEILFLKQKLGVVETPVDLVEEIKKIESQSINIAENPSFVEKKSESVVVEEKELPPAKEIEVAPVVSAPVVSPVAQEISFKTGLGKTRQGFLGKIKALFRDRNVIDQTALEEIEELLVTSDVGIKTASKFVSEITESVNKGKHITEAELKHLLSEKIRNTLNDVKSGPILPQKISGLPYVVLVLGVNGVGKTTTTAKLAYKWNKQGLKVVLAAADTYRAAAVEQLRNWGKQMDVPVIFGAEESKPQTVVFDALDQAIKENADVLIIDTAGRLHNKSNLMQEVEGIRNVIRKKLARDPDDTILVVDGATGQNALSQAREFNTVAPLTGVIVTKLDGTPKGGVVVAIKSELGIPVRYIGFGESRQDLKPFDTKEFTEALLGEDKAETSEELLTTQTSI